MQMEKRSLKKNFRVSTGFEPVTSANTGAMLYQLIYEAKHWEPGHFVGSILSPPIYAIGEKEPEKKKTVRIGQLLASRRRVK